MTKDKYLTVLKVLSVSSTEYLGWADWEDSEAYIEHLYTLLKKISPLIPKHKWSKIEYKFPLERKLVSYEPPMSEYETTYVSFSTYANLSKDMMADILHNSYSDVTIYNFDDVSEVTGDLENNDWIYIDNKKLTREEIDEALKIIGDIL